MVTISSDELNNIIMFLERYLEFIKTDPDCNGFSIRYLSKFIQELEEKQDI